MIKKIFLLSFVLLSISSYSQDNAVELCSKSKTNYFKNYLQFRDTGNQDDFDINYYRFNLEIFPGAKKIKGIVDIRSTCKKSGLKRLDLDFTPSLTVESIKSNGSDLLFEHDFDTKVLKVFLNKIYSKDEEIEISVKYSGEPGGSFHFDVIKNNALIWTKTEPYGSLDWFPCKNLPKDKADSIDMIVTVPSSLIVASNGLLTATDTLDDNKIRYSWHESYPIASYLISLAIHPYKIRTDYFKYSDTDSMPVVNYIVPDDFDADNEKYAVVTEMLQAYSDYFGEYPFINEKYGNAQFPWSGGMEHQTLTSLLGPHLYLLAHELAHQWWGDMITCKDFHHIWLNEGFATYSEALWTEYKYGKQAYHDKMMDKRYLGEGTIYVEDITTNPDEIFDGNLSYRKGAWVLHMLRHFVGDDRFFKILKSYGRSAKRYGTATTEDFEFICENISGKDLDVFFDQWIYGDYHPIYLYDWSAVENEGKYKLTLDIEQFQTQNLFSMPVDISIKTEDGEENFVIDNYKKLQEYSFDLDSKPIEVTLDKDDWILKEARKGIFMVNQDNNEMTLSISNIGTFGTYVPDGVGNGLIYPKDGKNILYFGSLMFGNSDDYIVDVSEKGSQKDFQHLEGTKFEINAGTISNLDINIKYSDAGHPDSKNIVVDQTSYSWNLDPYRELILFKYNIINQGSEDLDDFYLSQFMDFDISDFAENYIEKDESKRLLYQHENGIYCGIKLLDNSDKLNYVSVASAVDYLSESKKYKYLKGELNDFKQNQKGDWSTMLSVGPYSLNAGDTLTINFALVGGTSESGIKTNADRAQSLFDKYLVSNNDYIANSKNHVEIFPNPVQNKINMQLYLNKAQMVKILLYDMRGNKVFSTKRYYDQGTNTISINRPLKSGMYYYKIETKSGYLSGKIVK